MNTYYVDEEMLGDEATEQDARRMVELLQARGYDVEYGSTLGNDQDAIPDEVWEKCLDILGADTYAEYAAEYGTVTYLGKEFALTMDADFSNRVFPGWFGDAEEGDVYTTEYSAQAIDANGNDYRVYWQFDVVKGEEPEDASNYPWDDEHVSQVRAE